MKDKYFLFQLILYFPFMIFTFSIASAIEVGGHLTEDTVWNPVNNPYLVIENLYIDAGVTLTILPGTEIKLSGASCTSWQEFDQNFWLYGGDSVAKMFWVDGRIIAEGTQQDSIIFTRMQDDPNYYWGTVYITEQAEMCRFEHCKIEYSVGIGIAVGDIAKGAISIYNGKGLIRNCLFNNNGNGLVTRGSLVKSLEMSGSIFSFDNNINNFVENIWGRRHISIITPAEDFKPALLANNEFINDRSITASSVYYVNNQNTNCTKILTGFDDEISYFYDNSFTNCTTGIDGSNESYLFIKKNIFIICSYGVDIDDAYVEISDNYFEGCSLSGPSSPYYTKGIIENNIISNSGVGLSGRYEIVQNNIIYNCGVSTYVLGSSDIFRNNLIFGNSYICNSISDNGIHENNIYLGNEEIFQHIPSVYGNPIFRNCILDFELPPECIDAGGNIWVDSLSFDSLFIDWQNGDFHLIEGSLAIDAGFDTTGYCPFDMDYNQRIWDGDEDGNPIIDIGPYEYGSTAFGGIEGYTYETTSGEPVDYVLLKINNQPGEFEFSDSSGYFEFRLPAGVYDIYASRVFYDDVIVEDIEVIDGEFTEVEIPMTTTLVGIDEQPFQPSEISNLSIFNYPNPVRNSTTISFTIPRDITEAELKIYNIKGQLVKNFELRTPNSELNNVVWDGKDGSGKPVANGIYFYKLSADRKELIKKMIILR